MKIQKNKNTKIEYDQNELWIVQKRTLVGDQNEFNSADLVFIFAGRALFFADS